MKLRGLIALVCVFLALSTSDVVQRLVIAPFVWLFPSRRIPLFSWWQKLMAAFVLEPIRAIGGARIPPMPKIPGGPGVLIVMNHQSLLDIPIVATVVRGSYPRIVTRQRYTRWIPVVSHMARLYRYPVVDAGARGEGVRRSLSRIEEAAVDSDVPLVIFPEGHRSRDGEIGPFKKAGLRAVLAARPWTVYLVVVDGFWQRVTLKDLLGGATEIDGRVDVLGPYAWTDPSLDPSAFTESLRDRMLERLTELRAVQAA